MRHAKYFSLIIIIALMSLLCSCDKGGNDLEIKTSPSDKTLIDLASQIYDESQLLELVRFKGSINELNAQYPIECVREVSGNYRVSYLGHESIVVLIFTDFGHNISAKIHNFQISKSDLNKIIKGQSIEEVIKIDPNGEYLFLYTGRNDVPKTSSHYTKEGYLITIEYDISNTVIGINEELI